MKCIAALNAMAVLRAQGKAVAAQWSLQLPSLAPPSRLFFGAPNASRHVAEVFVTSPDHVNASAESLHYKAAVKMQIKPPNAVTPALLHFISQRNCLQGAGITGQTLLNCRAAAAPSKPTNTK